MDASSSSSASQTITKTHMKLKTEGYSNVWMFHDWLNPNSIWRHIDWRCHTMNDPDFLYARWWKEPNTHSGHKHSFVIRGFLQFATSKTVTSLDELFLPSTICTLCKTTKPNIVDTTYMKDYRIHGSFVSDAEKRKRKREHASTKKKKKRKPSVKKTRRSKRTKKD